MKAALVVNITLPEADANLDRVVESVQRAAGRAADLVLFPEAAVTGLINNDDPAHDLPLGQPIPGPATQRLGAGLALRRQRHRRTDRPAGARNRARKATDEEA